MVHTVERGISDNNFIIPFDFSSKLAVFGDMVGEAADLVLLAGDFMVSNPFLICLLFTNPVTGKTQSSFITKKGFCFQRFFRSEF